MKLITDDPQLGRPVESAQGYLRAEFTYAVLAEGALHLDDLLTRRTRLSYEVADRGRPPPRRWSTSSHRCWAGTRPGRLQS